MCASLLDVKPPELFIKQDPTFNAYTIGTNEDNLIVIHSGLLDAVKPAEMAFIIGHELGHIRSRHVTYGTLVRLLHYGLGIAGSVLYLPLAPALDAWSRQSELTADRAGLLACLNPEAAVGALLLLAVGSRKFLQDINLPAYLKQEEDLQGFYGKLKLWVGGMDHPYLVTRVRQVLEFAASESGKTLAARMTAKFHRSGSGARGLGPSGLPLAELPAHDQVTSHITRFCKDCGFEMGSMDGIACPVCGKNSE
jgi:Zn-dependent protease with chaperone function